MGDRWRRCCFVVDVRLPRAPRRHWSTFDDGPDVLDIECLVLHQRLDEVLVFRLVGLHDCLGSLVRLLEVLITQNGTSGPMEVEDLCPVRAT